MSVPEFKSLLRQRIIEVPTCIAHASGIRIFGRLIRSLLFTTDIAIIRNNNADAVIAVYPFTPQPAITHAIMIAAESPVLCGVGGGTTSGSRVVNLALDAEFQGAFGVVVNSPISNDVVAQLKERIDIPIVVTVVSDKTDIDARLKAGADIINISGASKTAEIVAAIRKQYPYIPIIATGGPTDESIEATIAAGANAITYTPPTSAKLFSELMTKYR